MRKNWLCCEAGLGIRLELTRFRIRPSDKNSESGSDLREKPDPNSALDKQPYPIVKKSHPDPALENDPDPTF